MNTHPTAEELAKAVAQWIDTIRPQLNERDVYLARVATHALGIVAREVSQRSPAEAALAPELSRLTGAEGNYAELVSALCAQLREGKIDLATPGLLAALRADTLARLAIDQPNYRHES